MPKTSPRQIYFCEVKSVNQFWQQHTHLFFVVCCNLFVKFIFTGTICTFYHFFKIYKKTLYDLGLAVLKLQNIKWFHFSIEGKSVGTHIDLPRVFLALVRIKNFLLKFLNKVLKVHWCRFEKLPISLYLQEKSMLKISHLNTFYFFRYVNVKSSFTNIQKLEYVKD